MSVNYDAIHIIVEQFRSMKELFYISIQPYQIKKEGEENEIADENLYYKWIHDNINSEGVKKAIKFSENLVKVLDTEDKMIVYRNALAKSLMVSLNPSREGAEVILHEQGLIAYLNNNPQMVEFMVKNINDLKDINAEFKIYLKDQLKKNKKYLPERRRGSIFELQAMQLVLEQDEHQLKHLEETNIEFRMKKILKSIIENKLEEISYWFFDESKGKLKKEKRSITFHLQALESLLLNNIISNRAEGEESNINRSIMPNVVCFYADLLLSSNLAKNMEEIASFLEVDENRLAEIVNEIKAQDYAGVASLVRYRLKRVPLSELGNAFSIMHLLDDETKKTPISLVKKETQDQLRIDLKAFQAHIDKLLAESALQLMASSKARRALKRGIEEEKEVNPETRMDTDSTDDAESAVKKTKKARHKK